MGRILPSSQGGLRLDHSSSFLAKLLKRLPVTGSPVSSLSSGLVLPVLHLP